VCCSDQNYGILGCLREQYEDLGAACKEEVFKRQAEAANDWRTDKELNEACQVGYPCCQHDQPAVKLCQTAYHFML